MLPAGIVTECQLLGTESNCSTRRAHGLGQIGDVHPASGQPAARLTGAMSSNDEASRVASALPDLRGMPLSGASPLTSATLEKMLLRVLPESAANPVPVAAFGSAI